MLAVCWPIGGSFPPHSPVTVKQKDILQPVLLGVIVAQVFSVSQFDHCLFLCFKIHPAILTSSTESMQWETGWDCCFVLARVTIGSVERRATTPGHSLQYLCQLQQCLLLTDFTSQTEWLDQECVPYFSNSCYIKESWLWNCLAEHPLFHCLDNFTTVKLNVHTVRKMRDTWHLGFYLREVS